MSKTVTIESPAHFQKVLSSSKLVVADFWAEWCGPCKQIAPIFEQLSTAFSRPNQASFVKIDTDKLKDIAFTYEIRSLPTFIVFRNGKVIHKVLGSDAKKLQEVVNKVSTEVEGMSSSKSQAAGASSSSAANETAWLGADLPRGYADVTNQIELQRCEVLNFDSEAGGNVRVLFESSKPNALSGSKNAAKDWVQSDMDEQLLLFMPFQSMIKLHTLQVTSLPDKNDEEAPMRPRTIKLFTNKPHNLGFEDAEDLAAVQAIDLKEEDWNKDGTASIGLRFVKFQNITSLVVFVVDGDGSNDSEKTRIDRIRLIGETGEKMGSAKLEKIGDEPGE